MHTVDRVTLSNGLQVIAVHRPHLHRSRAVVFAKGGSRVESKSTLGWTHLLEHMMCRGTNLYPTSHDLDMRVEGLGGGLNGFTDRDLVGLDIEVPYSNFQPAVETLAEILLNPTFPDLDLERGVVVSELQGSLGPRGEVSDPVDLLCQSTFKGSGLAFPVLGTKKSLHRITQSDLHQWHRKYFGARNLVLVLGGPQPLSELVELGKKYFHSLPPGDQIQYPKVPDPVRGPKIRVRSTGSSNASVIVGFPTIGGTHPWYPPLDLLGHVLDDGMSSRIQKTLRSESGLSYEAGLVHLGFTDTGLFGIGVDTDPDNILQVTEKILGIFTQVGTVLIGEEELSKAKLRERYHTEAMQDSLGALTEFYGQNTTAGILDTLEGASLKNQRVTPEDILNVASNSFCRSSLNLVVSGKVKKGITRSLEDLVHKFRV